MFETSLKKDVERRDFTVNALAYDPISKKLVDYTEGLTDLNKDFEMVGDSEVRFKGYASFNRCCRFMGSYI